MEGNESETIAIEEEGVDGIDEGSSGVGGEEAAGRGREPVDHGGFFLLRGCSLLRWFWDWMRKCEYFIPLPPPVCEGG